MAALGLAIVWLFVWPSDKATGAGPVQYVVLRWFHAVVWLLLAAAAFAAAVPGGERVAQVFGLLALATYAAFLAVVVQQG